MDNELDDIRRNGELLAAALAAARDEMENDADGGNALALAVAMTLPGDAVEEFISALRTFVRARESIQN